MVGVGFVIFPMFFPEVLIFNSCLEFCALSRGEQNNIKLQSSKL